MKPNGHQLVHLVLTLVANGDLDTLPNVLGGEHLALARELGELVKNFDYLNSIEFNALTNGKSPLVLNAHRKRFSEPVKREEMRRTFHDQVRRILRDGQVENYLSKDEICRVESLRNRLKALDAA